MARSPSKLIDKIVSGGQTGVDRAALDAALVLEVPCGGWCPQGRKAEDGTIPLRYPLTETPTSDYSERTRFNVRDSDGTLILTWGEPAGGTLLTLEACRTRGKPHLVIDLSAADIGRSSVERAHEWIAANLPGGVLNVAGPRASTHPAVYELAKVFVATLLEKCGWS
jgi:hypothetical protein